MEKECFLIPPLSEFEHANFSPFMDIVYSCVGFSAILISCGPVNGRRTKRMYAMCPPKFVRLGNECYYFATEKASWLDAHFECKDRNSKLAEPFKFEDYRLRKYLQRLETGNKIPDFISLRPPRMVLRLKFGKL